MPNEEKKIIIDEDWKSQVQAEREAREREPKESPKEPGADPYADFKMPPASFEMLLSTLVTEAMVALGRVPHPSTQKPEVNLDQAKYFVDTIEMLETKTRGNLTDEESQGLTELLHQLRMLYVSVGAEVNTPHS